MTREDGLSIISLIIIIVILLLVAGFAVHKIFGENGVVNKLSEADDEYNQTEIVDKLNLIVKEKYILDYKYAQENQKNIDEIYTNETVIKYLLDKKMIEEFKDVNDNLVENEYFINPEFLNTDLAVNAIKENGSEGNGTKVYKIKKINEKYMIYFVNKEGEEKELGELILKPKV